MHVELSHYFGLVGVSRVLRAVCANLLLLFQVLTFPTIVVHSLARFGLEVWFLSF